jgi:peptide-methionine (R)-S-oxide reductase
MKQLIVILSLALFTLMNCQNNSAPVNKSNPGLNLFIVNKTNNPYYSRTDTTKLDLADSTWRRILPDSIYRIARLKETERPFTGKFNSYTGIGTYYCAACGNALFLSDAKFASTCGWPSFFKTIRKNSIVYIDDLSYGMTRTETVCGRCGGHLGHIFDDGPPPTGKRYCMNSIMLDFEPRSKQKK